MGISKELSIDLVLLFGSSKESAALGEALWASMQEVADYMAPDDDWFQVPMPTRSRPYASVRPRYRRWYIAADPPAFDLGGDGADQAHVALTPDAADALWGPALQRRSLFDAHALGAGVSSLLQSSRGIDLDFAAVVTDAELVPPADWRYILWAGHPGGAVISAAPMDPRYWGSSMTRAALARRQQIKHGVRASTMSVVGSKIGLTRCENPTCFMFAGVDSVSRLPEMRSIGPEHQVIGLRRSVFPATDPEPEQVTVPLAEVPG